MPIDDLPVAAREEAYYRRIAEAAPSICLERTGLRESRAVRCDYPETADPGHAQALENSLVGTDSVKSAK